MRRVLSTSLCHLQTHHLGHGHGSERKYFKTEPSYDLGSPLLIILTTAAVLYQGLPLPAALPVSLKPHDLAEVQVPLHTVPE